MLARLCQKKNDKAGRNNKGLIGAGAYPYLKLIYLLGVNFAPIPMDLTFLYLFEACYLTNLVAAK